MLLGMPGIRHLRQHNDRAHYDRKTFKMKWRAEIEKSAMLLQDWQDLPFMVFTARYDRSKRGGPKGDFAMLRIVAKQYGKLIYDEETTAMSRFGYLDVDWANQCAELRSAFSKIVVTKQQEP
jgi:hypothetical protein